MDSDEDFKHYSSCYYDDDTDRAFYPENARHRTQLDAKSEFDCEKILITAHQEQTLQQFKIDNLVRSSDKVRNGKIIERWTDLSRDFTCDAEANNLRSVSIRSFYLFLPYNILLDLLIKHLLNDLLSNFVKKMF